MSPLSLLALAILRFVW